MAAKTTVCSAPGKVLLAGGYLILSRPHAGTVLALDARFYSAVTVRQPAEQLQPGEIAISVASPQFGELRHYIYASGPAGEEASLRPVGDGAHRPNRYVEIPLLYALTVARALTATSRARTAPLALDITLAADNGFYSQVAAVQARGLPLTAASLASLPPMLEPLAGDDGEVAKTGLGSSATLVTSLVAALLHALGAIKLPSPDSSGSALSPSARAQLETLHALAQLCHCAAQGKVGSGFDVCVATFGSQRYTRFSPSVLEPVLRLPDAATPPPALLLATIGAAAAGVAAGGGAEPLRFDHEVTPFQLPPGVQVMMADVCCGAHTPSMVKQVLAWRASHPEAPALWAGYASSSARLQVRMRQTMESLFYWILEHYTR